MADNKNMVKFGRGTKSLEDFKLVTGYENMIYFNTTNKEIYVGDNKYGFSEDDKALLGNGGIKKVEYVVKSITPEGSEKAVDQGYVVIIFNNDQTAEVCIPNSDKTAPGLMTSEQVSALNTVAGHVLTLIGTGEGSVAKAKADAKDYADGLVAGLDANVSSAAGQKLTVNVVEVDGKITEVNVTDNDIASAASLKTLTDKVDAFLDAEGLADKTLDTLKEIQDFINTEAGVADQMILDIAANKTAIEKEVTDRENAIKGLKEGEVAANTAAIAQEVKDRQAGDEATLASANAYTDSALMWIED